MRLLARSFVLAWIVLLAVTPRAFGHALYEHSDPPSGGQLVPPGQIRVRFTEAVEPSLSKIQVLDGARRPVDLGDTHADPGDPRALVVSVGDLSDGAYTVSWQALSAVDGHVTRGLFPLVVGAGGLGDALEEAPAFVPEPSDVVARWLGYLAALALLGGFIFRPSVLAPSLRAANGRTSDLLRAYDGRFRRLGLGAATLLIGATVLGLISQAAKAADVSVWSALGAPLARLLGTRLGLLWEVRLALAVLLLVLLWWGRGRLLWWGGPLLGAAVLALVSLGSHAAAVPSRAWLAAAIDWAHQIAAAAWVGGLFAFAVLVPPLLRPLKPAARHEVLAAIVPRFSTLAIVSVIVLALTGFFHSWLQVTTVPALDTLYGYSLLVKLLLIAPMLGLGAANLMLARPRLAWAAAQRGRKLGAGVPRLVARVRWAVVAEAALGVGVLLATAMLTASEPARETYARRPQPIALAGTIEDVGTQLRIAPGRAGVNQFELRLDDGTGQPPPDLQRVTLRFTYLDQDLGSGTLQLERREDGSYGAVGGNLSTDGGWQIEPILRRRGREDARTGFRTAVASAEAAAQAPSLDLLAVPSATPRLAISLGLMGLGLALAFWISRSRSVHRRERLALYAASFAVAMIGGVLYSRANATGTAPRDVRELRSPFAPDAASLAQGKLVYEQSTCASCHGVDGRGNGPLAPSLRPRPADFRVHMESGHTDGELYNWVTNGVPGTAMPGFADQLSEADRWHVINYIRGFAPQAE